jgi:hypothetical protein
MGWTQGSAIAGSGEICHDRGVQAKRKAANHGKLKANLLKLSGSNNWTKHCALSLSLFFGFSSISIVDLCIALSRTFLVIPGWPSYNYLSW